MIYVQHTSFQLYHCEFPQSYLQELYVRGEPTTSDGVTMQKTKAYDFCKVEDRGKWFDIFVALIRYILSGESKAGFLNKQFPENPIHTVLSIVVFACEG